MNASAFTGTISFLNSGQYAATGSLAALGTTIRLGAGMSDGSAQLELSGRYSIDAVALQRALHPR